MAILNNQRVYIYIYMYSAILSGIFCGILSDIWRSPLRPGIAHWDLERVRVAESEAGGGRGGGGGEEQKTTHNLWKTSP